MSPRGPAGLLLALVVSMAVYRLSGPSAMALGQGALGALGVWGLVSVMLLQGFGIALVYTAVYDGPRALGRLLKRQHQAAPVYGTARTNR